MSANKNLDKLKEFGLSTLSVKNTKTVYLIIAIILLGGASAYFQMPRESFPEVEIPEIYVNIPYPGNSPEIIEDKIIRPIEKELNTIKGIDEITSTSIQDFAVLDIKFEFTVSPKEAKRLVEDAISDAKSDKNFATDLPTEPMIKQMDPSDFPIININLSGNYPVQTLKERAEILEDQIEALSEISDVDIRGVQDQKLKVEIKKFEAEAKQVSFNDIEQAIQQENVMVGAGNLKVDGIDHFILIDGKFKSPEELQEIVVKHEGTDDIYLRDVADVSYGDTDTTSYARQNDNPVVMIDVKKRAGSNVINAIDKIRLLVAEAKNKNILASDMSVSFTNDQSFKIRSQISNLENSIIFGVILVVGVLLFFLGLRNALFVGIAIPLSMFMSFMLLDVMGVSLNVMVLFALVLALGMLVDNGIVVVENIYRFMDEEGLDSFNAAIKGVGEVAWPIIASTATTLAAFVPLALWPGIMGEFMQYLPITLIIVLGSSLFVALVINPVLTAVAMKVEQEEPKKGRSIKVAIGFAVPALLSYMGGSILFGNLFITVSVLVLLSTFFFYPATIWFQNKLLPKVENAYKNFLTSTMHRKRPITVFVGTLGLFVFSVILLAIFPPQVEFFPDNQPNYLNIFVEHPIGTEIKVTNETTKDVKVIIDSVLNAPRNDGKGEYSYNSVYDVDKIRLENGKLQNDTVYFIESVIEQVGKGTSDPRQGPSYGETPNKARITVSFCEFSHRKGLNTSTVLKEIQAALKNRFYADVKIVADKEKVGPPQKAAINIEVRGSNDFKQLVNEAEVVRQYLDTLGVNGVQKLALDVELNKAEIDIKIDREFAKRAGMSTGQIASSLRTALFGKDVSTYDINDETHDINVRFGAGFRGDLDELLDMKVMFMNNRGQKLNIPIRSVVEDVEVNYKNSAVKRKDLENVVTVFSGVEEGYNANDLVAQLKGKMQEFENTPSGEEFLAKGLTYKFTGQMEEQQKEMSFLSTALMIAVFLILLIIVTQFNSFSTPAIILMSVFLSLVGVFLGIVISRDKFVIIMTMIGIISLAGIVVNNAIVLVDYTNLLRKQKKDELGYGKTEQLSVDQVKEAIIKAGQTRLRPVLLTAITTILGLFPLAVGLNIDFVKLYTDFDPNIFVGGDNLMFFGPMSWTIIYGLTFATFLTLVVVPVMYYLLYRLKNWMYRVFNWTLKSEI